MKIDMRVLAIVLPRTEERPCMALTFRQRELQRALVYKRLAQCCAVKDIEVMKPQVPIDELFDGDVKIPIPFDLLTHLIDSIESILNQTDESI